MGTAAHQRQLTTIYLGGKLGKLFGEKWSLMVNSPIEAIHAININLKGKLVNYLVAQGYQKYYKVSLQDKDHTLDSAELGHRSGNADIYIWPTVKGRNSGAGKIIAGVFLIAATLVVSYLSYGTVNLESSAVPGLFAAAGNIAIGIGVSLVLGGISQLLAPHQKDNGQLNSNSFQGSIAGGTQGGCVPVVYGTALVSQPTPISVWFEAVDYSTTVNNYVGAVELAGLPGGGTEVVVADPNAVVNNAQ